MEQTYPSASDERNTYSQQRIARLFTGLRRKRELTESKEDEESHRHDYHMSHHDSLHPFFCLIQVVIRGRIKSMSFEDLGFVDFEFRRKSRMMVIVLSG